MKKVSPKKRTMGTMKRGLDVTEFAVELTDEFDIDLKTNKVILVQYHLNAHSSPIPPLFRKYVFIAYFDNKGLYEGSSLELNKVDPSSSNLGLLPL